MGKNKREPRKKTKKVDFLEPIDITKFGSEDDPCFGKLYNLSTKECKRCGDSELCGVIFSQNMNKVRKDIESKQRFKDLEMDLPKQNPALTKWVREKKAQGLSRSEIIIKAKKTFGSTRDEIKTIYKTL